MGLADPADDLAHALAQAHGESVGVATFERYRHAFPAIYRDRLQLLRSRFPSCFSCESLVGFSGRKPSAIYLQRFNF